MADYPEFQGNDTGEERLDVPLSLSLGGTQHDDYDLHSRSIFPGTRYSSFSSEGNYIWSSAPSVHSSMQLSAASSMAGSSLPPSLVHTSSTYFSDESIGTDYMVAGLDLSDNDFPEMDENGSLQLQLREITNDFECQFGFLGCHETFVSLRHWDTHCKAHCPPAKHQACPFRGCSSSFEAESGEAAWTERWTHINEFHRSGSTVDSMRRPNSSFIRHMWREGIIDTAQSKDLTISGYLSNGPVIQTADSRRREDRPRGRASGSGLHVRQR